MDRESLLIFPEHVLIKLIDKDSNKPIKIENVIIGIHLFSSKSNDYYLGPFFTDKFGKCSISIEELLAAAETIIHANNSSFAHYLECDQTAEVFIYPRNKIYNRASEEKAGQLLSKEQTMFRSKEEMIEAFIECNNHKVRNMKKKIKFSKQKELLEVELKTSILNK